jgi:predicted O-methyltransferase YrrM
MSKFDEIASFNFDKANMSVEQAEVLRDLIVGEDASNILELCGNPGVSTAYLAAILEDKASGSVTTFSLRNTARPANRAVQTLLGQADLSRRIATIPCKRSYTWALQRLLATPDRHDFDLCYVAGHNTWDSVGISVLLVDMLLRNGGLIVLSNMDWSIGSSSYFRDRPEQTQRYDDDEIRARPVRLAWEMILPHLGYVPVREFPQLGYAVARKSQAATKGV